MSDEKNAANETPPAKQLLKRWSSLR